MRCLILYRVIFGFSLLCLSLYIGQGGISAVAQEWTGASYEIDGGQEVIKLTFSQEVSQPKVTHMDQGTPRLVLDWETLSADRLGQDIGQGQKALDGQGPVSRFRFARRGADGLRLVLELDDAVKFGKLENIGRELSLKFTGRTIAPVPTARLGAGGFVNNIPVARIKPSALSANLTVPSANASSTARSQQELYAPAKRKFEGEEVPYPRTAPHLGVIGRAGRVAHSERATTQKRVVSKPVIVIDPGHGGYDPGAIGANGTKEKVITTAVTNRLAAVLRETGRYDVVTTRTRDVYVEHDDRLRVARERGADLFISLHADSTADGKASGASVYTLADRSKGRSKKITKTQNWILDVDLSEQTASVGNILVDLAQRKTLSQSSQFAAILVAELESKVPLVRNSHRRAGYYVLLAPDVPAVLLELGFISNAADERRLNKRSEQEKIVKAVTRAINGYFDAKKP